MENSDIFRDPPVRYLGYSNEVGEALRPLIPRFFVRLSYGLATAYVLGDTFDKSTKVLQSTGQNSAALIEGGDVLTWQMLASVIIPGFTINRITWASGHLLRTVGMRGGVFRYIPTAIGLACIPFIITPIDNAVDLVMDQTYRKFVKKLN